MNHALANVHVGVRLPIRVTRSAANPLNTEKTMRTHFLRNSLVASALACAFAAVPAIAAPPLLANAAQADQMHEADNQTVPGKVDDGWITTKVKSKLAVAKNVKATDITVETKDGVVTLTGAVPSASVKSHVVREAKSVKGVKSVDASGLTVTGG
jgi:hyperosmotically inducible protein